MKSILMFLIVILCSLHRVYAASEKDIQAELDRLYHSIDLEKIDKVIPKEREYTEEESKSFIDEDGDGAEDRLENFFSENSFSKERKKLMYRLLIIKNYILDLCVKKNDISLECKKLYATYLNLKSLIACKDDTPSNNAMVNPSNYRKYRELADMYSFILKKLVPKSFYRLMDFEDLEQMFKKGVFFSVTQKKCGSL